MLGWGVVVARAAYARVRSHRLRHVLLCALAALPLAVAAQAQTDARARFPRRIVVVRDTVWFVPEVSDQRDDRDRRAIGFVPGTGMWVESRIPSDLVRTVSLSSGATKPAESPTLTTMLAPGLALVHVKDTVVQQAARWPARVYALHDQGSGRTTRLLVPQQWRARQPSRPGDASAGAGDYATEPSAWTVHNDTVFVGLRAGPPVIDDDAQMRQNPPPVWKGGVLVVEPITQRVSPLLHPGLDDHFVASLVANGDRLWIGTNRRSLSNVPATTGLLRYRLTDRTWTQFSSAHTPLPGNAILHMHAVGDLLAIVSDSGAAMLDMTSESWSALYFAEAVRNDSVVWVTTPKRPSPDSVLWAARRLADYLDERRLSAFAAAARRAAREPLVSLLGYNAYDSVRDTSGAAAPLYGVLDAAAAALADTAFLPFLTQIVAQSDGEQRLLASEAILRMNDSRARAFIAATLDSAPVERAIHFAGRLAKRGDPTAQRWVRTRIADSALRADTLGVFEADGVLTRLDTILETVIDLADTTLAPALLGALDTRSAERALRGTIEIGALHHQRALAEQVEKRPRLWSVFLEQFVPGGAGSESTPGLPTIGDRAVRGIVVRVARKLLSLSDSALTDARLGTRAERYRAQSSAAEALVRFGQAPAVPFLIEAMERPEVDAIVVSRALVRLTGLLGAPTIRKGEATTAQRNGLHLFWKQWWSRSQGGFVVARPEAAERALDDWNARAASRD